MNDKRLWRVIRHYVDDARKLEDYSAVRNLGIDETSRKGHNYITVMVDLDKRKVIYTTEGKDHTTVDKFVADFKEHKGVSDNIEIVTCDMSLGFKKGITENLSSGPWNKCVPWWVRLVLPTTNGESPKYISS